MDRIENHVAESAGYVTSGQFELEKAREYQSKARKVRVVNFNYFSYRNFIINVYHNSKYIKQMYSNNFIFQIKIQISLKAEYLSFSKVHARKVP